MIKFYWYFLILLNFVSIVACGDMESQLGTRKSRRVVPYSYILGLWDSSPGNSIKHIKDDIVLPLVQIETIGSAKVPSQGSDSIKNFLSIPDSQELFGTMTLFRVDLSKGISEQDFLSKLGQYSVALWEPNRVNELFIESRVAGSLRKPIKSGLAPFAEDNFFSNLYRRYQEVGGYWWLNAIRIDEVYRAISLRDLNSSPDANLISTAPVIAILDSGIDFLHPALSEKIWVNPQPGLAGCDNDKYGCDTTLDSSFPLGKGPAIPFLTGEAGESCPPETIGNQVFLNGACIHGTHVAGLIVADDEYGVPGICPYCKVLPIKVVENIEGEGKVPDSAILKGLKYVQNINKLYGGLIKVVNSSFGKFEQSLSVTLLVKELTDDGVMIVGASGNENTRERVFPAALEEVIAVTAISREGKKASYSNFGSWINLAAPGGDVEQGSRRDEAIISTVPGGDVYLSQGTSVATPLVSGVAGLIQMLEPELRGKHLKERLLASADGKLYDRDFADGYNNAYGPKNGREYIPGLLGRGILDGHAAYLGEINVSEELKPSERVSPNCGEIKGGKGAYKHSFFILTLFYLMPILYLGFRRRGVS